MKNDYFFVLFISLFTMQISVYAQNVQISNIGNPTEPSIMMDPNNPDILVAGSVLDFYHTSNDGGLTWTTNSLSSPYGVWGDPVIDVDANGDFYFFHLSNTMGGHWIDRIVCQKSTDNGHTWSNGTFTGLNGSKAQDKQWSVIDPVSQNIYLTWTEFDEYGSVNPLDKSRILFSKSVDKGNSWSVPVQINLVLGDCVDGDDTVEGAVPAVGPNGEIYVSWAGPNGIVFNRSFDEGNTWLSQEILVDSMPSGWDYDIPGISRANGLPITKCDLSGGPNEGTIYINWSDQRNGDTNTDIWMCKSMDGGDNWSNPIRVNNDTTQNHQFFTWMDIDQTNGNLFFVFYDRRNYSDKRTDVYMAISTDGGSSFMNRSISESPFIPTEGVFFGDYTNIVAHNNIARPIWTRYDPGVLSIWTDVTPIDSILSTPNWLAEVPSNEAMVYPNPAPELSYFSFKVHQLANVKLELFNINGQLKATLIENEQMNYGRHIIPVNTTKLNLSSGEYIYVLSIDGKQKTIKTIILD